MKTLKYTVSKFPFLWKGLGIGFLLLILLTACKRECQDERADNYKENRKDNCDFSNADNWNKDIIVDSMLINGVRVELIGDDGSLFEGATYDREEGYYSSLGSNYYYAEFDAELYITDTIESIQYTIGLPVASTYNIEPVTLKYILYSYDPITSTYFNFVRGNEAFYFIEEKEINGVNYYYYNVMLTNIQDEVIIQEHNFSNSIIEMGINYEVFGVKYTVDINKQ